MFTVILMSVLISMTASLAYSDENAGGNTKDENDSHACLEGHSPEQMARLYLEAGGDDAFEREAFLANENAIVPRRYVAVPGPGIRDFLSPSDWYQLEADVNGINTDFTRMNSFASTTYDADARELRVVLVPGRKKHMVLNGSSYLRGDEHHKAQVESFVKGSQLCPSWVRNWDVTNSTKKKQLNVYIAVDSENYANSSTNRSKIGSCVATAILKDLGFGRLGDLQLVEPSPSGRMRATALSRWLYWVRIDTQAAGLLTKTIDPQKQLKARFVEECRL